MIYILMSAALSCSCDGIYGTFAGSNQVYVEIAAINRSQIPVSLNVYGAYWAEPQDTIYLKPYNGLWKIEEPAETFNRGEILPLEYSVIRADFNDGDRVIYFDVLSDLPHNPCDVGAKEVWDDRCQHKIIEFDDEICKSIFEKQDSFHQFDITMACSPSNAVDSLVVPGSTEGYFTNLFPAGDVRYKLKLGAAVYTEAESIDKVRFADGLCYEADSLETSSEVRHRFHNHEIYPYYDLEQLRNLGMTNFGCDFAALTGRGNGDFDSFCGIVFIETHVGRTESISDREHPEEFIAELEGTSEKACVIDEIEYGNLMILLAEADCSHQSIHDYVSKKHLQDESSPYYQICFVPKIQFHLITLDEDGEFVCQTGGEELAAVFHKGYDAPALHPLSFHVTDLKEHSAIIHIPATDPNE